MTTFHDPSVYERFRTIGNDHADDVFRCWHAREFPRNLWDELAAEGLLAAATSRGCGLEASMPWLAAAFEGVTRETLDGGFMISVAVHGVFGLTIGGGTEEAQRLIVYAEMIRRSSHLG